MTTKWVLKPDAKHRMVLSILKTVALLFLSCEIDNINIRLEKCWQPAQTDFHFRLQFTCIKGSDEENTEIIELEIWSVKEEINQNWKGWNVHAELISSSRKSGNTTEYWGIFWRRKVTSVITPNVPSLPINKRVRSYLGRYLKS